MCIAFSGPPGSKVDFDNTKGAAWVVKGTIYSGWHAMSYQNKVKVNGIKPKGHQWSGLNSGRKTGAAMLLVFPLANDGDYILLSAEDMPNFLKEMTTVETPNPYLGATRSTPKSLGLGSVEVQKYGLYDVVVFKNASIDKIQKAIATSVAIERQPELDEDAINFIINAYNPNGQSNFAIALFCYDPYQVTGEGKESLPVTIMYQTSFPEVLFFSGLDEHDPSKRPDFNEMVNTNHQIAWGFEKAPDVITHSVKYTAKVSTLGAIVPERVAVSTHYTKMPNGDFVVQLNNFRAGRLAVERWQPPSASLG
ncbi:hypothetical protein A2572_00005 [Candidatus Collierbacteria bacterium RIFOXYD1_FULL_40_9]|uniref:Uncharacterized protein n=1 Tax=Candidatus Collierbacteria bacterium RIFOXYD1_FULL_40_9 TaxID=1817731 RepID=A0A1F5FWD4_9BACT|nr:MAG: hypothetical protein A2572_00005 [Candidatus Collierbacteria bacterium RIFOXYD1_FULL_40_9]